MRVYDNILDNQPNTSRKFAKRWFGPYIIREVNDNVTYHFKLIEMDGTTLGLSIAGKRIKIFYKRREDSDVDVLFEENIKIDNIMKTSIGGCRRIHMFIRGRCCEDSGI